MKHVGGTRWKIRGKRLMLVCGPYEDETIVWGPFDLTMAVQQACRMLEAIDKLAVTTNTTISPAACGHSKWQGSMFEATWTCADCGHTVEAADLSALLRFRSQAPHSG